MSGLTSAGFEKKRLEDIKVDLENALKSAFGNSINLLPESVFGQLVGIYAERLSLLWELAEAVYNSQYPDTAQDVSLDNVCALTGITRLPATYSTVNVDLYGTAGTIVPAGTIFSVFGNSQARFLTSADVTLGSGSPNATVLCRAESVGRVQAPANTLTVIETPVAGLDSINNPLDAYVGREIETDEELRLRRFRSLQIAGAGTVEAIRSRLLNVENVQAALVYENTTMIEDPDGRPPKSLEAVVQGGDVNDIALTIWNVKPAGIATYGNQTTTITDTQGFTHDIKWSRPTEVLIYIDVTLTTDVNFNATAQDIKNAYKDYAVENIGIGDDVIVYPDMICVLGKFTGIIDVDFRIGILPNPTTDDNIIIEANEIASFDTSRINVTIV